MICRVLKNGLKTGFILSVATTVATVLASLSETGKPWAATNAIAHIVDGDEIEQPIEFDLRATSIGLGINTTAMLVWSVLYEAGTEIAKIEPMAATGFATAAAAWVIDYKIVPKRLTPGVEKHLTFGPILAIYAVLGTTLALSSFWRAHAPEADIDESTKEPFI